VAAERSGGGGCGIGVADVRRQRHADGLEQLARHAGHRRAQDEALAVLLDLDLLQPIEIGEQFAPFGLQPCRGQAFLQLLGRN